MTVYTQNVILCQLVIPHVELSNPSFNCLAKLEAPNLKKIIKYCVGKSMLFNISQNKIMLRTLTKGCLLEYLQKKTFAYENKASSSSRAYPFVT